MGCALSARPSYAGLSLWTGTSSYSWDARPPLPGDLDADVAIVGAGLTGLWAAYYLLEEDPTLRVHLLEAETAGFGASGRNGGWCSALFPLSSERLAALPGSDRAAATAQHEAMRETVDEVGRVIAAEGIRASFHKGGTLTVARTPTQLERARAEVAHARSWGRGEDQLRLLDGAETRSALGVDDALGATFTPDCAAVQPADLVRGLAETVERLGGHLHERTRALAIEPGLVRTEHGTVRAEHVLRATEAWTSSLPGHRRDSVPVYSLVVATEPLSDAQWNSIGLADRPTFSEHRHLIVYGQRTADGRLVFGGRGAPYHFGSSVDPAHDEDVRVWGALRTTLREMLPVLDDVAFTHAWGGPLGITRDWAASVGHDRRTGLGWAGGYVGDGVSTTNLAGRTLRDLVLDRDTDLVRLPWVNHRSPLWEPEPARWLGINAGLRAMSIADAEERRTGRPSRIARVMAPLLGH